LELLVQRHADSGGSIKYSIDRREEMKYSTFEPINNKLSLLIGNSIKDRILEGEFPPAAGFPTSSRSGSSSA
jgi:hypothetical protein